MSNLVNIHESGNVSFSAEYPGLASTQAEIEGDPVSMTIHMNDDEFNGILGMQQDNFVTYDHDAQDFIYTLRTDMNISVIDSLTITYEVDVI